MADFVDRNAASEAEVVRTAKAVAAGKWEVQSGVMC